MILSESLCGVEFLFVGGMSFHACPVAQYPPLGHCDLRQGENQFHYDRTFAERLCGYRTLGFPK